MDEAHPRYSKASDRAMRYVGLLSSLVLAFYSYLVVFNLIPDLYYAGPEIAIAVAITWMAVSIYYFFVPAKSRFDRACRLIVYHIVALVTLVLVTGFEQPFANLFVLLFIATNLYFGRFALVLSIASVIIVGTIDALIRFSSYPAVQLEVFLSIAGIVFLGIATVTLISVQETRRQTLVHSRARERLQYDRILTIINNLTDATFSTDDKGTVLMYNAASLDLLDTNDSVKGKNIATLLNLTDTDNNPTNLVDILKQTSHSPR